MKTLLALLILISTFLISNPSIAGTNFNDLNQPNSSENRKFMYCKQINTGEVTKFEKKNTLYSCPTGYKKTNAGDYKKNKKNNKVVYCKNNNSGIVIKSRSGLCINNYSITSKQVYDSYKSIGNTGSNKDYKVVNKTSSSSNKSITNSSDSNSNQYVSTKTTSINKDDLRDELKYWKSLLDDGLITEKDYNSKKNELLSNSTISNKSYSSNSNSTSNNNLSSEIDNLMNTSSSSSNNTLNPCSYVRMSSNVCNKKYAEIKTWSDTRLCMNLEDVFFVETEELYLETARLRNIVCKNGRAYDSGTSSNIVNSFEPEDYETNCYKELYTNKVTCKTKKIDNSTRELVGDILGELINQMR